MTLSPAQLGLVRGLGMVIIMAVLSYLSDASHLNGVVGYGIGGVVSMLALSYEHYLSAKSDNTTALFGAVSKQTYN